MISGRQRPRPGRGSGRRGRPPGSGKRARGIASSGRDVSKIPESEIGFLSPEANRMSDISSNNGKSNYRLRNVLLYFINVI